MIAGALVTFIVCLAVLSRAVGPFAVLLVRRGKGVISMRTTAVVAVTVLAATALLVYATAMFVAGVSDKIPA